MRKWALRITTASMIGSALLFPFVWAMDPVLHWLPACFHAKPQRVVVQDMIFIRAGVQQPETLAPDAVDIPPETQVVGVEAGGKHRAYVLPGMARPATHVVNDLIQGVPVSVAYCNLRDCATAYTSRDGAREPLDLGVYGLVNAQLALYAGGRAYFQEPSFSDHVEPADQLPYARYPFQRTTWGAWRENHPDTDVYLGDWPPPIQ
jgi:Protein of unknown function (DUF3179)